MGICEDWQIRTHAIRPRGPEIGKVDNAITLWINQGAGAKSNNLIALSEAFFAWKQSKPTEFNMIKDAASALEAELKRVEDPPKPIGGVTSSVLPIGWTLVDDDTALKGESFLPESQRVGPLSGPEIQRINESFRRARFGAEAARDALLKVKQIGFSTGGSSSLAERAYVDFFGAYDNNRFSVVLANLTALALAFSNQPKVIDCRNRTNWCNTYGGCVRANIVSLSTAAPLKLQSATPAGLHGISQPGVTLTGTVNILIGRAFLSRGDYARSTDATVGTLVHEFSHGTFKAADVPRFTNGGTFEAKMKSTDPNDFDYGNSLNPFNDQASTEEDDKHLAANNPVYAIVNADCYGQFVRAILQGQQA